MSKFKVLMVTSVAALGALGVSAGSAAAATTLACPEFIGNTTSLTPPVQTLGGGGSFGFSGSATCSANGGVPDRAASISASGTYTNTLCGTGTATGSATITVNGTAYNVGFTIQFAGGVGALRATTATGGGVVDISPATDNKANPPGDCVTHFDVVGSFAGSI